MALPTATWRGEPFADVVLSRGVAFADDGDSIVMFGEYSLKRSRMVPPMGYGGFALVLGRDDRLGWERESRNPHSTVVSI